MAGVWAPKAAQAQSWSWQPSAQARGELNSNPGLSSTGESRAATASVSMSAALAALHSTEAEESRGEGELILAPGGRAAAGSGASGTQALGRLSLRHRLSEARSTWSGKVDFRRDRPLALAASAADLSIGGAERDVTEFGLGWSHALHERLSADVDASHARTRLGSGAQGADYAVTAVTAALQAAWRETRSVSASVGRTEQRLQLSHGGSRIDSLRLGLTETLSETASMSLSLARADTTQDFTVRSLVCPLPVQFCQGGLVRYVAVESTGRSRRNELSYSATGSLRWDERTALSARVSRSLTPNARGVSREDLLALSASGDWATGTRISLSLDQSISRQAQRAAATTARLRSLTFTGTHQLDEQLSLVAQWQQRQFRQGVPQSSASGSVFSISLQYQGATLSGGP